MRTLDVFIEILRQGLKTSEARIQIRKGPRTEEAHTLADELYRLCIEFGVPWNDFRRAVLDHLVDATGSERPDGLLVNALGPRLPLVLFALEVMSEDSEV